MSYLQNKYYNWYQVLVEKAKKRNWNKTTAPCYVEIHHIIPKSLGGSNKSENLIALTAKEHYIAHRLLVKFTKGEQKYKMQSALFYMLNVNEYEGIIKNKAKIYEIIKNEYIALLRGENHFNYGLTRSEKTKELLRQKRALQIIPKECYALRSEKVKDQIWMNDGIKSYRIMPDKVEEAKEKGYVEGRLMNYITKEYRKKIKNKTIQQWHNIKKAGYKNPKEYVGESKLVI